MTNLATYRFCAAVGVAVIFLGVARNEPWTVVAGGAIAVACLRFALVERLDDPEPDPTPPPTCSHVRLIPPDGDPVTPTG